MKEACHLQVRIVIKTTQCFYAEVRCATKAHGSLVVCLCVCVCVCVPGIAARQMEFK